MDGIDGDEPGIPPGIDGEEPGIPPGMEGDEPGLPPGMDGIPGEPLEPELEELDELEEELDELEEELDCDLHPTKSATAAMNKQQRIKPGDLVMVIILFCSFVRFILIAIAVT